MTHFMAANLSLCIVACRTLCPKLCDYEYKSCDLFEKSRVN